MFLITKLEKVWSPISVLTIFLISLPSIPVICYLFSGPYETVCGNDLFLIYEFGWIIISLSFTIPNQLVVPSSVPIKVKYLPMLSTMFFMLIGILNHLYISEFSHCIVLFYGFLYGAISCFVLNLLGREENLSNSIKQTPILSLLLDMSLLREFVVPHKSPSYEISNTSPHPSAVVSSDDPDVQRAIKELMLKVGGNDPNSFLPPDCVALNINESSQKMCNQP